MGWRLLEVVYDEIAGALQMTCKPSIVFTNRIQRFPDIVPHLGRTSLFDMRCQPHQGCFQGQLIGVHPLQHIGRRIITRRGFDSFREKVQA
ncbi:hypothetical protein [Pseudomonas grimontii]|uniref:hypothetical protein n=1 Tax=Pseudomonas grimontii TaxID=129847 RepID=UPI0013566AC8